MHAPGSPPSRFLNRTLVRHQPSSASRIWWHPSFGARCNGSRGPERRQPVLRSPRRAGRVSGYRRPAASGIAGCSPCVAMSGRQHLRRSIEQHVEVRSWLWGGHHDGAAGRIRCGFAVPGGRLVCSSSPSWRCTAPTSSLSNTPALATPSALWSSRAESSPLSSGRASCTEGRVGPVGQRRLSPVASTAERAARISLRLGSSTARRTEITSGERTRVTPSPSRSESEPSSSPDSRRQRVRSRRLRLQPPIPPRFQVGGRNAGSATPRPRACACPRVLPPSEWDGRCWLPARPGRRSMMPAR